MFGNNKIIRLKQGQSLAKIKYLDASRNFAQIEYIDPKNKSQVGLFSYSISDLEKHWELLPNQKDDDKVISLVKTDNKNKNCHHEWSEYVGLNESFYYCKICDRKKD